MSLTPSQWNERFLRQSFWTEPLRKYLLSRLTPRPSARILEIGCGTGVITASLHAYTQSMVFGLDLNPAFLRIAHANDPQTRFTGGNALQLPFPAQSFDAVVCHFFLLWVLQPELALAEMVRVTHPGGSVVAFAEPDYGGRIDYPPPLDELGRMQTSALREQGADPQMGRKLSGLFHAAGLADVETGLLGGEWRDAPPPEEHESEWSTLEADLSNQIPASRLTELRRQDEAAWAAGERVLYVPTFYAIGKCPLR